MAVKIRLKRIGRKNRPFYRVCVFDSRTRRDGAPIEELGAYDPHARALGNKVSLDAERASYWLSVGAQPSETVSSLLRGLGIDKNGQDAAIAEKVAAEAAATDEKVKSQAPQPPAPKAEAAPAEAAAAETAPAEEAPGGDATAAADAAPTSEPAGDVAPAADAGAPEKEG